MHDRAKREQVPVRSRREGAGVGARAPRAMAWLAMMLCVLSSACGGGDDANGVLTDRIAGQDGLVPGSAAPVLAFVGEYEATWSASATITSAAGAFAQSYADTALITVSAEDDREILMAWTVGNNLPSGTIRFAVTGNVATATGIGTGGSCWTGSLTNGNQQTTCATFATAQLDGDRLVQHQTGQIRGITPGGLDYAGTYEGTWTGTRIR